MTPASLPTEYRRCVGVMLLNRDGLVFTGRRIVREAGESWQMPQGGIDAGEDLREAALRELHEETGISAVEVLAESAHWYAYDLPPDLVGVALRGRFRGQTQKWFAMRFLGRDSDIDLSVHEPEFDAWRWTPLEELTQVIVPFKRQVYAQVVQEFRHLAVPPGTARP
jgi:putative (di)nucleoside polyphosphate hydrolase